jgi:SAM-dependent methyltransferase
LGGIYGAYMGQAPISRVIGRIVWGGDTRPLYDSFRRIADVPAGGLIVDVPCGAGVAFRGLAPDQDVRYVAVDLSDRMLARARRVAARAGLDQIEFIRADAASLPVGPGSADLVFSHFGLHCFPDPEAALREAARCMRPGGRLEGSMIASGPSRRQRFLVRPDLGAFGPAGTVTDLRRWLQRAQLDTERVWESGCFAYFSARGRP